MSADGVGADSPAGFRKGLHELPGGFRGGRTPVRGGLDEKAVFPRASGQRAALDEGEVDFGGVERRQHLEQGAGASQEAIASAIPLGRYAESEDIANMVLFLASEKSSFVTGSQFRVDGGMLS